MKLIIGYLFSTVIGTFILWIIMEKCIQKYFDKKDIKGREKGNLKMLLGIIERLIYTTVLIINQPAWIGIWLALKVAGSWKYWHEDDRRAIYNSFLIGSALSIIVSYLGAWIAIGNPPLLGK